MLRRIKNTRVVWKNRSFSIYDLLLCLFFILICEFTGYVSSVLQTSSLKLWYPLLNKSVLTPPPFIFAGIWAILYAIVGVATFLAFKGALGENRVYVILIFFIQLCFNFFWTVLFFGLRAPFLSFVELLLFIIVIISMMRIYSKGSRLAALLLYPYLFWTIFATYLNFIILLFN